jgi:hypothetical protein
VYTELTGGIRRDPMLVGKGPGASGPAPQSRQWSTQARVARDESHLPPATAAAWRSGSPSASTSSCCCRASAMMRADIASGSACRHQARPSIESGIDCQVCATCYAARSVSTAPCAMVRTSAKKYCTVDQCQPCSEHAAAGTSSSPSVSSPRTRFDRPYVCKNVDANAIIFISSPPRRDAHTE